MSQQDGPGFLERLFGKFRWEPPNWLGQLRNANEGTRFGRFVKANVSAILAVTVLLLSGIAIYEWRIAHPPPPPPGTLVLVATVRAPAPPPKRTKADPPPAPAQLFVDFSASAAPLEQLNRTVPQGVTLTPAVAGEWKWITERTLAFAPTQHWPIGQKYTVTLDRKLIERAHVVLPNNQVEFQTQPFVASISSAKFYQDPLDPKLKQVVATFDFNYPVDPSSFEKHVTLTSVRSGQLQQVSKHALSVTYDDFRFQAFVRSEPLALPLEDHVANLVLEPGSAASENTSTTFSSKLSRGVTIPGRGNKFRINDASAVIARTAEGDPEQVVVFSCSSDVNEQAFAKAIKIWALPKPTKREGSNDDPPRDWLGRAHEVGPAVLKKAKALVPQAIPGEREVGTQHSFKVDVAPGTDLFVRVEKGVEAFGGYVLAKTYEQVVQVPQFPRELRIAHRGSVLSLTGDKKLMVQARGIPAVRIQYYRVKPSDLNHLISLSSGNFDQLSANAGMFSNENISEVFTEIKQLNATDLKSAQYVSLDFAPYLKEGNQTRGMYVVSVDAWNPETNSLLTSNGESTPPEATEREYDGEGEGDEYYEGDANPSLGQLNDRRFVLLTDLGVIDKVDAKNEHWVFVQSFKTGEPMAAATVEVLGKNGFPVVKATTDAGGVATLPSLKSFTAEKLPIALVVRRENDVSFLPLNRYDRTVNLTRFDIGGVETRGKATQLSAYAFSDRGLYRPGETVHLSTIVRAADWSQSMNGVPVELSVLDARALVVKKERVVLDATAFTGIDFTPDYSATTGTYQFLINIPGDKKKAPVQIGSALFRVEEFQPDSMRISSRFENVPKGWVTNSKFDAHIELNNLIGTPAADHKVRAQFTLSPFQPHFSQFPEYHFFDSAPARRAEAQTLSDVQTDEHGVVRQTLDLSPFAPATYWVNFYTEGFELGEGRSVSTQASIIVSPRTYLLGYKTDGDLSFIQRGSKLTADLIAIDSNLKRTQVSKLKLSWIETRMMSVLTKLPNGTYQYQSLPKEVTRKTDSLDIADSGKQIPLFTDEPGTFQLVVKDADDVVLLRIPYMVAGTANLTKDLERNAELKVSLDRSEAEPGQTLSVQIVAPYTGAGVITVERDRVYSYKTFKTTTSSTVQTIDVPAGLEVNGYVQVTFIRALDSKELFVSPLSYGVAHFKVRKKSQRLDLSLKAPERARPGRPLSIQFKTDSPSKVAIIAVDQGILQVARYSAPDPLQHFLQKRALEVSTHQMVDQLLPEFHLATPNRTEGGDFDEAGALAKNLNPFKRKGEPPAVFWSKIVNADATEKSVVFNVPESFAGTLRIYAVAASPSAMASGNVSTVVKGPFVLLPNVPTFLSPGDRGKFSVSVTNNVEGSNEAAVKIRAETNASLKMVGGTEQTLSIKEGREALATFEVEATDSLGSGEIRLLASGAKEEFARTASISVRPTSVYRVVGQAGTVRGGSLEIPFKRTMFDALSTRQLTVSLLPLGLSSSAVNYLDNYPHMCSEQLISRAAPALVFLKRPSWGYSEEKAHAALDRAFGILFQRQNADGQFGYWAANSFNNDWIDTYITLMLTEAKDREIPLPGEVHQKALGALKTLIQSPVQDLMRARLQAQALYVLARNGQLAPGPTSALTEWLKNRKDAKNDVAYAFLAATLRLVHQDDAAGKLIGEFELSNSALTTQSSYYDEISYRAQVLYLIAKHFSERVDAVGSKIIVSLVDSLNAGQHSLSASWSLMALDAYARVIERTQSKGLDLLQVETREANGPWKKLSSFPGLTATVKADRLTSAFRLKAADGPPVFYSLTEGGFDKAPPTTAIQQGVEVIHSFETLDGKPTNTVRLGDDLRVRMKVRSLANRTLWNMAIVDLLPSGVELQLTSGASGQSISSRLKGGTSTLKLQQIDAREDRIVFYSDIGSQIGEVTYQVKAVARGTFSIPSAQANGMYDVGLFGRSAASTLKVE